VVAIKNRSSITDALADAEVMAAFRNVASQG
jgi:hypothetical protein